MTYYKCDRCKKEIIDTNRTILSIKEATPNELYLRDEARMVDLCPDCLKMLNNFLQKKIVNYNDICGGNEND